MKELWECEYCDKQDDNIVDMSLHEADCYYNPVNKVCYSCSGWSNFYPNFSCSKGVLEIRTSPDRPECKDYKEKS